MSSVVITGVSSGIGYGAARAFVRSGYRVFGSVRRPEDASRLQSELGEGFSPLLFDVTDQDAVVEAAHEVQEALGEEGLLGLVNNAGFAMAGPLMHQPLDEVRMQFEINVVGLVGVTQAFLPLLGAGEARTMPPGRIVNVGSVGGKIASPFIGAYAGTKHAVEGISDSLRRELLPYGIDVILLRPGAVRTGIWAKAAEPGVAAYEKTDYVGPLRKFQGYAERLAEGGYSPEEFGRRLLEVFEARHPKTRYAVVPGRFANWTVPTLLSDRLLDRLIGGRVGLLRG